MSQPDPQGNPGIPRIVQIVLKRLGLGRGMFARVTRDEGPEHLLELYGYEGCPACRRVRRTLVELDLDFVVRSCGVGATRNRGAVQQRGGKALFPFLVDPNTGTQLYESSEIVRYLRREYDTGAQAD